MKSVLFFILILLSSPIFAVQQYIAADGTAMDHNPVDNQMMLEASEPKPPMNIPLAAQPAINMPANTQAPQMNMPPEETQSPQMNMPAAAQVNTPPQTASAPPIYVTPAQNQLALNNTPAAQPDANTASLSQEIAYSEKEQQEWFKSCINAQKDQRMNKYAQEYCQCGWDQMTKIIPAKNLISEDAKVLEATNGLLRSISSQCVVQVLANHPETGKENS